jgi:hypothetical protein
VFFYLLGLRSKWKTKVPAYGLSLFPNPAADVVSLQLFNAPLTNQAKFAIYSTNGELMLEGNLTQRTWLYSIDIQKFLPGAYILRISDIGQPIYNITLIVI